MALSVRPLRSASSRTLRPRAGRRGRLGAWRSRLPSADGLWQTHPGELRRRRGGQLLSVAVVQPGGSSVRKTDTCQFFLPDLVTLPAGRPEARSRSGVLAGEGPAPRLVGGPAGGSP